MKRFTIRLKNIKHDYFVGLGVRMMFDLNLSSSHFSTSYALDNENTNTSHAAWVQLNDNESMIILVVIQSIQM